MSEHAHLLTVAQLADALQIPAAVVASWRLSGGGPPPVNGDPIPRWHAEDVRAWVTDRLAKELFRPPPADGSLI